MQFTTEELERYAQQIKLSNLGKPGQAKLKKAKVLCIGAGGLGSPLLFYLAAAGVGQIGVMDHDVVELSNLQRQILFDESHIGVSKALIAREKLLALNPAIQVMTYFQKLTETNAKEIINDYQIIIDCTDNFTTHYLINHVSHMLDKPVIYASILRHQGISAVFFGKNYPCLQCIFPYKPQDDEVLDCRASGVLGVLPGLLGVIQAADVIKCILGEIKESHVLTVDMQNMRFKQIRLILNPECTVHT